MKLGLIADKTEIAHDSYVKLVENYSFIEDEKKLKKVDCIVVLGGDGFMLHSLHKFMDLKIPFYGMNCGTIGFLLNEFSVEQLNTRIKKAKESKISPLSMHAVDIDGIVYDALAFNEVSLLRETKQSTNIEIQIDGKTKINSLVGDGILVATPAGSSAYNFSVRGPIIPLGYDLLALTPISPFRPRGWRGALLPGKTEFNFIIKNAHKRPISVVADFFEYRNVKTVLVKRNEEQTVTLLFDHRNPLEDKLITEQFL